MKVSRRGLGGLFAGAVAAVQGVGPEKVAGQLDGSTPLPYIPTPDVMSPEDEIKYLLSQGRDNTGLKGLLKRSRFEEYRILDPDVKALKSCSPVGLEAIQRQRWHRAAIVEHQEWITHRINDLLERYPYLKVLT